MLTAADASTHWALIVGNLALAATFLMSLSFVLTYSFAPFWQHESGRNVMALMFALMLITGLSIIRLVYADNAWFLWLRVAVLTAIPFIIGWRLWMLIRVQYIHPRTSSLDRCPECPTDYVDERDQVDESQPGGGIDDAIHSARRNRQHRH